MKVLTREAIAPGVRGAPSDLTEPERTLLRLVPASARTVAVGAPAHLLAVLRDAGCDLLACEAFPPEDALARFAPAKVVVFDAAQVGPALADALQAVSRASPGAEVVVAFWNASSASSVLGALATTRWPREVVPDAAVRAALAASGWVIASRAGWRAEDAAGLAPDAERALRDLFAQLNPSAGDDWILYEARRPVAGPPARAAFTPGLLSVVIRNHSLARLDLLDQTLFSLACQEFAPLEIVLVTQATEPGAVATLTAALERHRRVGGYTFQVVSRPSKADIRGRLLNVGVEAARGQYLAFLDDDDVVYPRHYVRLVEALRRGTAAWSVAQTRTAHFTADASGALYCRSKSAFSHHEAFSLSDLVQENYIPTHAYVLDRERLGAFPVAFSEEVNRCEDYVFLLRLAAIFRPVFLAGGASCEYRMRDDGSNSNMMAAQPADVMARERAAWQVAREVKDAMKRRLQMLVGMEQYEDAVSAARKLGYEAGLHEGRLQGPPLALRHRIVDGLNSAVKGVLPPGAHRALKGVAALLARAR